MIKQSYHPAVKRELDELKVWMVNSWRVASVLAYPQLMEALTEYKRCRRIARDEYDRWRNYEDLHKR